MNPDYFKDINNMFEKHFNINMKEKDTWLNAVKNSYYDNSENVKEDRTWYEVALEKVDDIRSTMKKLSAHELGGLAQVLEAVVREVQRKAIEVA